MFHLKTSIIQNKWKSPLTDLVYVIIVMVQVQLKMDCLFVINVKVKDWK